MAIQKGGDNLIGKIPKDPLKMGMALKKEEPRKKESSKSLRVVKNEVDMNKITLEQFSSLLDDKLKAFANSADFQIGVQKGVQHLPTEDKVKLIVNQAIKDEKLVSNEVLTSTKNEITSSIKESASSVKLQVILWVIGGGATIVGFIIPLIKKLFNL